MFSLETALFTLSAILALAATYYKVPTTTLLQTLGALLAILLIFLNKFLFIQSNAFIKRVIRAFLLLIISLITQLLVISSGGFYSPYLILLHLFTLGTSFLLNIGSSIIFLILSVVILIANLYLNPQIRKLFIEDPFSAILYLLSFVVIIPLAYILMRNYHLKDNLYKILKKDVQLGKVREESILKSLTEIILLTDIKLNILYANQAAENTLGKPSLEVAGHSLLEVFPIKDESGNPATFDTLSIRSVLADKATHIVTGLTIQSKNNPNPIHITLQVRPIADTSSEVNQLLLVISDAKMSESSTSIHKDLEQARLRYKLLADDIKQALALAHQPFLRTKVELFKKAEEDLIDTLEIEDHNLKKVPVLSDIAFICKQNIEQKQDLAQSLGISLKFQLPPEEQSEFAAINLKQNNFPNPLLGPSAFDLPIDPKWFSIMVQKLIDISLLLASTQRLGTVDLCIARPDKNRVVVSISSICPISLVKTDEIFKEYYGDWVAKTGLRFGSGLEGFIAKTIASQLNTPLIVKLQKNPPTQLIFELHLFKSLS